MLAWLSVWSAVQTCIWPSWCHCHSLSLASVKSRLGLPFWYRLTWVVPDKRPLNGCVCIVKIDLRQWLLTSWDFSHEYRWANTRTLGTQHTLCLQAWVISYDWEPNSRSGVMLPRAAFPGISGGGEISWCGDTLRCGRQFRKKNFFAKFSSKFCLSKISHIGWFLCELCDQNMSTFLRHSVFVLILHTS